MRNLPNMRNLSANLLIASATLLAGCAEEVVVKRMKPQPPTIGDAAEVVDISEELASFEPPFPESQSLFEPEKKTDRGNAARSHAQSLADDESETIPEIELVGFGSVDARHALLLIDGRLEALQVGERFRNVRVLSISPTSVRIDVAGRQLEAKFTVEQDG